MGKLSTKRIVLNGLMIALVFVTTSIIKIPFVRGYLNIGDVAIMITGVLLGRGSGFIAGSFGSALSDVLSPYSYYAPITFIVKGLEGYIIGLIAYSSDKSRKGELLRLAAVLAGAAVMVAGYFIGDLYLLKFMGQSFGISAALSGLPGNSIQGGVSAAAGYILTTVLARIGTREALG